MSLLDDMLRDDLLLLAGDTTGLAEEIVYKPHDGTPRTVRAFVERRGPEPRDGIRTRTTAVVVVTVANDPERGISSAEIDLNADRIIVAPRPGGAALELGLHYPEGDGAWVTASEMTLEVY